MARPREQGSPPERPAEPEAGLLPATGTDGGEAGGGRRIVRLWDRR